MKFDGIDNEDDVKFDRIDDNDMITMWNLIGLMMKTWRQCNGDVKFDEIDDDDVKFDEIDNRDMKMTWNLIKLIIEIWRRYEI